MSVIDDNPWADNPQEQLPTYEEVENIPVDDEKHNKESKHTPKTEQAYEQNINDYKPTCPVIFFEHTINDKNSKQIFTIHCEKLDVLVECFVNTAIVTIKGQWTNRTKDTLDCIFALPTTGIVTNITIHIGSNRVITTAILPHEDSVSLINKARKLFNKLFITPEDANPYEQYVPDLFRFPFNNVIPGDTITLECQYIEELDYYKKGYIISLPLYFPPGTMIESASWD
eukprot:90007_1